MTPQQFHDYLFEIDKNYKSPTPTAQNANKKLIIYQMFLIILYILIKNLIYHHLSKNGKDH